MSFDFLALAAVRHELEASVLGGQVQRIVPVGTLALVLEVYARGRRRSVLLSAEPQAARACLVEDRPVQTAGAPTPFLLLLRKHVRDGRLVGIEQPPFERVLILRISKRDEGGATAEVRLIIETMGRRSNVVLVTGDGVILDALKRSGPQKNPRRPIIPRAPYLAPPAQDRLDPLDPASFDLLASGAEAPIGALIESILGQRLAGFSPLAAREVAFRVLRDANRSGVAPSWLRVKEAVATLLEPLDSRAWQPTVAYVEEQPLAFAPYPLLHLEGAQFRAAEGISQAIALFQNQPSRPRPPAAANRSLLALIGRAQREARRKRTALGRALESADKADALRVAGETILSRLAQLEAGEIPSELGLQGFELDERLTAVENAQRFFREYRKARDAGRKVPAMVQEVELRLQQLEQLEILAELADSTTRLRALQEELAAAAGHDFDQQQRPKAFKVKPTKKRSRDLKNRRPSPADQLVRRSRTAEGLETLIGASARGNELVTFKLAEASDLWFHARGVPGAHVVLKTGGREPSQTSLLEAARLAALNSGSRTEGRVQVDYAPRKQIRKIPRAPVGLVTYQGEQTLTVNLAADGADLERDVHTK